MLVKRKKRKPKVSSEGSGRYIPADVYEKLYKSWEQYRDVRQAAKDAGVTVKVARKYIDEGAATFPAISKRVSDLDKRVIGNMEADIVEARSNTIKVVHDVSQKLLESLTSVEVVLSNSRLYDENGEEKRTKDGKPIIPLDAGGVRTVLQAAKDIAELLGGAMGGQNGNNNHPQGQTVNVGVVLSPENVREAAKKAMRTMVTDPVSSDASIIEGKFQEIAVQEAIKRVNDSDGTE